MTSHLDRADAATQALANVRSVQRAVAAKSDELARSVPMDPRKLARSLRREVQLEKVAIALERYLAAAIRSALEAREFDDERLAKLGAYVDVDRPARVVATVAIEGHARPTSAPAAVPVGR